MTMRPPLVEACCDSLHTARLAQQHGAGRIELCGPGDGGTTPSLGLMARAREEITTALVVMIRPHTHHFRYDADDMTVMRRDIATAKALGIDGIVVGPLMAHGAVHEEQLAELVALARPMRVTFHRAFDVVPDQIVALDTLLAHGVDHVLTSGQSETALAGALRLALLQARASDRLTIMAGGGVRGAHVRELLAQAPLREVHARGTDPEIIRALVAAINTIA